METVKIKGLKVNIELEEMTFDPKEVSSPIVTLLLQQIKEQLEQLNKSNKK